MTTFIVTADDEKAGLLKSLLSGSPLVKSVSEAKTAMQPNHSYETVAYKIKQMLLNAKEKHLFDNIEDASEWQREVRKEWDRDF